jgi:hypothetical protein
MPPGGEDAFERFGRTKVVFCPYRTVSLLSKVSTVALSLARLLDGRMAVALDTF